MNENNRERQLGPIIGATIMASDINYVINSYQDNLGYLLVDENTVSQELANLWQAPNLLGHKMAVLSSSDGSGWLRVIENGHAKPIEPLMSHGWMALETNVSNVDIISKKLKDGSFSVIGKPAYLQVSDAIKAMQVIGPAGEVTYLTQVDKPVPPFELPMTSAETGPLFIPVLSTPDREKSLAFYQRLNNADEGLCFDTKITVLNNAWKRDIEHQYPVATLQLDGKCLFEIDQVPNAKPIVNNDGALPSGISLITCRVKHIESIAKAFDAKIHHLKDSYYCGGDSMILLKGPAGELIELVN